MIQVRNISKSYSGIEALSDISFSLKKGEVVGLLGLNGAGKSTLMKILSGIMIPDKGEVFILDKDIRKSSLQVRQHIGYLSEDNPLYEDMYVSEYISYIAKLFRADKQKVSEVIEQVGLKDEYHKKISTLSKGNRQRVGIAQVLVHNPDLIILDEPTVGLDPNQRESLNKLFAELGKDKTILLSTHILQDVREICSRIMVINKGRIVLDEKIEQIGSVENTFYQLTNENNSR